MVEVRLKMLNFKLSESNDDSYRYVYIREDHYELRLNKYTEA